MRFVKFLIDIIFPPRASELCVRACTTEVLRAALSPAIVSSEVAGTIGLLPYGNESVQACILEAKFHGNAHATALLARILHEYLLEFITETLEFSQEKIIIVPIPLSRARLRSRGYNQAEQIANRAIIGLESYIRLESDLLVRTRDTLPQTSLGGNARRLNLLGAFTTTRPCDSAHTYIVFDDVVTTGATLSAAVQALTDAGATHAIPLALAR